MMDSTTITTTAPAQVNSATPPPPPPGYSASDIVPTAAVSNAAPIATPPPPPPGYSASDVVPTATANHASQSQQPPSTDTAMLPHGTVSAIPDSTFADKLKNWSNNVSNDLKNETDITGVGRVLKAMGAHGLNSGVSPGVADFMGSLPLGLLRATKGGAELLSPGQRWAGTKDTIGGALDAVTIPGGFIAPEAGELSGEAGDALLTQAGRAAKAAQAPFSVKALQPKLQGAIASAIHDAAAEHGVGIPEGTSLRDVTQTLSDALRAKAHGIYQQLDNALGGTRFQTFDEQLGRIQDAIKESLGIDPDKDAALSKRLADVTAARNAAMDDIRAKGLDPDDLIGQADATHRKAMALGDVSKAVRASTDVHPSQLAEGADNTAATNVRTKPLFNRMQQLATPNPKYPGTPSRLAQALGEQRAAQLLHDVDAAHLAAQKIAARNAWIGKAAKAVGAGGLAYEAVSGLHHLLGASE